LPLWHSPGSEQLAPFVFLHVPAPSQSAPAGQVSCWPAATGEHVPTEPALLHVWQSPLHALSQQTPSTQLPLWHSDPAMHAVPFGASQAPRLPHSVVHSLSGSVFVAMFAHEPLTPPVFAALHALHAPVQVVEQQTPSRQNVLPHSASTVQAAPTPSWVQALAPLHAVAPLHSLSGSRPFATGAHVPFAPPVFAALHALHRPLQPVLQQTPSMQLPLRHSAADTQVWPLL
jgi:hypothetical protein